MMRRFPRGAKALIRGGGSDASSSVSREPLVVMSENTHAPNAADLRRLIAARSPVIVSALAVLVLALAALGWLHLWSQELPRAGSAAGVARETAQIVWAVSIVLGLLLAATAGCLVTLWVVSRRSGVARSARYRAVLEQSPNGTLVADADSLCIVDANPAPTKSGILARRAAWHNADAA